MRKREILKIFSPMDSNLRGVTTIWRYVLQGWERFNQANSINQKR